MNNELLLPTTMGIIFIASYILWSVIHALRRESARHTQRLDRQVQQLQAGMKSLEAEVTRQAIELEEQEIKLGTQKYWLEEE